MLSIGSSSGSSNAWAAVLVNTSRVSVEAIYRRERREMHPTGTEMNPKSYSVLFSQWWSD